MGFSWNYLVNAKVSLWTVFCKCDSVSLCFLKASKPYS